ncbi:glutamate--cysteine ligase [Mangrovimicrobium sediminis]|uniref:Glutamate--cysteine ligase n=1 Tax=Mangrovimicrobium sediminis TaxID=2562682 RepID=A0A4Z0M4P8_9GAMM|nr:glutamate--cysteine ligase [Haliea sp. SAOS-164]
MHTQLAALSVPEQQHLLRGIQRGIEKESLRVAKDGCLAQTPHPEGLGSALTHSWITTDYSEALLEFITPVNAVIEDSLAQLEDIHRFAYSQLQDEMLWSASMPCVMGVDSEVPVARYGSSNVARMKTVYRVGLGHRYGRVMQTIAGIHYNFSMPTAYWEQAWAADGEPGTLRDYVSERYLGLIRNFRRFVWLPVYLFGVSPALCASFLRGRDGHGLQPFQGRSDTLHLPHATSLRMGDLGYNSSAQKGLKVCYNSLHNYVETLRRAIMQPHADYAAFCAGDGGDYQQLNDSLLQIENEFYSPIRPKRVARSGETPLHALTERGIEYIEVRCIDVSPFMPLGICARQIRFMDAFLLYCLLHDSPPCDDHEQTTIAANLAAVVNRGREPGLRLADANGERDFLQWAQEVMAGVADVAAALDAAHTGDEYASAVAAQRAKLDDPELTPSARMLREMTENNESFFALGLRYSRQWAQEMLAGGLPADKVALFVQEAQRSLQAQAEVEASDKLSFEQYLAEFYAQYDALPGF